MINGLGHTYIGLSLARFLTSVCFSFTLQGFLMYQHLAVSGVYCIFWPDMMHKLARKSCYSLTRSGANVPLRKLNKLFRMSRGPRSTSKFGKLLHDSREMLIKGINDGTVDQSLIETWLPGVARDQKENPDTFTLEKLLAVLQRKRGSVNEFIHLFLCLINHC